MNLLCIFMLWPLLYHKGEKQAAFYIIYEKWRSALSKEKKQILLPLCFKHKHATSFKTPRSQEDQEEECGLINWKVHGLLTAHGELSAAFFIIVLLTCWNSSLWEGKKKSPPDCCLHCTYLRTPTYSFVLCCNKSVGRNGKWSGIFGVRLCHFTRDHVLCFQIKTLYMVLAWFLLSLFPVRPPSNVGFPEKPPQCRRS